MPAIKPIRPIELVATEWLAAERRLALAPGDSTDAVARRRAAEYERSILQADQEDLRLAWEAARVIQARCDIGSEAWAEARSVSELLRSEYEAARPAHA